MKPRNRKIYLRAIMIIPAWILLASLVQLLRASDATATTLYAFVALIQIGLLTALWYMSKDSELRL